MSLKQEMLATIEGLLVEAGHTAKRMQATAGKKQKADKSIVTEADLAITALVEKHLQPWLKKPGHFWIDEERIGQIGSPAEVFDGRHEYIWVTDPIDGTGPYANGRNTWGTIFGVLHKGAPFVGGFSMPMYDLLFLADGEQAWVIKGAWGSKPVKAPLKREDMTLAEHSFFEIDRPDFGNYYATLSAYCWPHMPESSVQGHAYTVQGQALGYNARGYWGIWDIAGIWAVMQAAGLPWHDRATGKILERFEPRHFNANWKFQGDFLSCPPAMYATLNDVLKKAE
jgi:myo-inositol-1(or 4)-monophosphatase